MLGSCSGAKKVWNMKMTIIGNVADVQGKAPTFMDIKLDEREINDRIDINQTDTY